MRTLSRHRASAGAPSAPNQESWFATMQAGDFEAAWRIADGVLAARVASRDVCWHLPRHRQWIWRGESLAGKRVLIRCYHGLGDTLQFIRFAAPLRAIASEVAVWVQPPLLTLVARVPGVDRVLPLHDGIPEYPYEVDVEVMELPHALRLRPDAPGLPYPYLSARPGKPRRPTPVAGIVWQAGAWDRRRSVPAAVIRKLVTASPIRIVSLQRGEGLAELATTGAPDRSAEDVETTACTLRRIDLVITVDTLMAHLAGGMGVPTWTLLHSDPDWRWMKAGSGTPWYPGMQLFRQRHPEDWEPVIDAVHSELEQRFRPLATRGSQR